MTRKLIKFWPLGLLLILTFLLRTIKLEELFYFTYDESVFAFVGRRLVLWHHVPLIGGATPLGFHVAPYFYWFFALTLALGKLNPLVWGWVAGIIAVLTTLMMFKVGETFASRKAGFLAGTFWAFSYLANIYDRHLWGLTFGPLFSLIILYCLYQIIIGRQKFIYLLGISLALIIHADLSYYVFLALAILVWVIFRLPIKKSTVFALSFVFISFVPLIVFDFRHNFANTKPVVDFLEQGRNNPGFEIEKFVDNTLLFPRSFSRLIYTFGDDQIAKQYSYCRTFVKEKFQVIPWYFVVISSIVLIAFVIKHLRCGRMDSSSLEVSSEVGPDSSEVDKNIGFRLIAFLIILYFLGIQVYGTIFRSDVFEHYITGTFAIFILIFARLVSLLPKKMWIMVLAIFLIFNLHKLLSAQNSMGLAVKRQAIAYTMQQVGDRDFSLDSLSTCWKYSGYRYLFAVFGREPVKSYVDPNFAYLYGTTPVAEKHPPTVVAFVVHDFAKETVDFYKRYTLLKSHQISSALFGNIEVIIMDNSSGWFDQPATLKNPNIPISKD